jgi:hypothetical protein
MKGFAVSVRVSIVEDSISEAGDRVTTFLLYYPRIIHSEMMTHRVFSRNTSSSRAVPIKKMIRSVLSDMAEPVEYGSNKPGMQAGPTLTGGRRGMARLIWRTTGYLAVGMAYLLHLSGVHKQIANRLIEPWTHVRVVLTGTDFQNFFALRDHPDADPTIQALARGMKRAMSVSIPRLLREGEWHIPFVRDVEKRSHPLKDQLVLSAARCASTSYLRVDAKESLTLPDAMRIWEKLVLSTPVHASPVEHQCQADPNYQRVDLHGNLRGMIQFRKTLPNEAVYD